MDGKISQSHFRRVTGTSYAVLCMPGLGADSYRTWESLALGAMPVMEKGMGLDRTVQAASAARGRLRSNH